MASEWQRAVQGLLNSKLVRSAVFAGFGQFVVMGFGLLQSILFVRYLGAEFYGAYQYIMAALALLAVFYSHLDQAIGRFFSTADNQKKAEIVFAILAVKMVIFLVIFPLLLGLWWLFLAHKPVWQSVLAYPGIVLTSVIICISQFSMLFFNTLSQVGVGLQQYRLVTILNTATSAIIVLLLLIIVYSDGLNVSHGLPLFIGGQLIVQILMALFLYYMICKVWPEGRRLFAICFHDVRGVVVRTFSVDFRRYILPLQVTSVTGYLRQYLPGFALGVFFGMTEVGYFRIVQQIFTMIHKFVPGLLNFIFPGFVQAWDRDRDHFRKRYRLASVLYVLLVACVGLVILLFDGPLLSLWRISITDLGEGLILIFALKIVFAAAGIVELQIYFLGKDTRSILIISPVREVLGSLVTVALVMRIGLIGAGVGQVVGDLFTWVSFAWMAIHMGNRMVSDFLLNVGVVLFSCGLIMTYGWYVGILTW